MIINLTDENYKKLDKWFRIDRDLNQKEMDSQINAMLKVKFLDMNRIPKMIKSGKINSPVFLRNMAFLLYTKKHRDIRNVSDYLVDIGVLRYFIPFCERWIENNHVSGSYENQRIVIRMVRSYIKIADWSLLDLGYPTDDLRNFVFRLKGLIPWYLKKRKLRLRMVPQ